MNWIGYLIWTVIFISIIAFAYMGADANKWYDDITKYK